MGRLGRVLSALTAAVRNENVRRVELAWGAAVAAEWAHFVALGVFAFEQGGASAVGIAGLVRLLPAALVAPFAASLGDRFPRERFLLAMVLVGSGALAGSGAAAFAGESVPVFVLAGVVGLSSTLIRPALQALLLRSHGRPVSSSRRTAQHRRSRASELSLARSWQVGWPPWQTSASSSSSVRERFW